MRKHNPARNKLFKWNIGVGVGGNCGVEVGNYSHRTKFVRSGVDACSSESSIRKNNSGVGASRNCGVSGDFEGTHHLAEGLFAPSASGEAFEGGDSDCSEKSHNANDGEEFDEGEGRPASLSLGKPR